MFRLRKWDRLPECMKNEQVLEYYRILSKRKASIFLKRCFDIAAAVIVATVLLPIMAVLSIMIKIDSEGTVIFRQERVGAYGKKFQIYKFRTMVCDADRKGAAVTSKSDPRITRVGRLLRRNRLDELPQIFNVIKGDMSFVGTRPEVPQYVNEYHPEMMATLLLPAGITSMTSIIYKNEDKLLEHADDADFTYINRILPEKMQYNLRSLCEFSIWNDIKIMFMTVKAVTVGIKQYEYADEKKEVQNVN